MKKHCLQEVVAWHFFKNGMRFPFFIIPCIDFNSCPKNSWIFGCVGHIFTSKFHRNNNSYIVQNDLFICFICCNKFIVQLWRRAMIKCK